MEGDPVSLPTPSGSGSGSSVRKERGAIAAQACDTCRARKQKCDEQRPKCGTCLRFKLECHYREPQPTKKDKTLVEILERIKALEGKIDKYHLAGGYPRTSFTPLPPLLTSAPMTATPDQMGALPATPFNVPESASAGSATEDHYRYASSVHQLFEWPVIQRLLEVVNLDSTSMGLKPAEREGPAPLQGLVDNQELPKHTALDALASVHRLPTIPRSMPISVPALTWDTMQQLSKAYFDSFNFLYPILDRQLFTSELMLTVFNDGFSDGIASVLAFLVFALGEVAIAGTQAMPIHMYNGRPSGFRGGTREEPPGLSLFNEARKRMGFNLTECSLENVQVFALASLYYGTCCHHTEFWRMTISASLACQALIASNPSELSSSRADLIRRAFWHCSIMETCLNLELGLPLTGLGKMETLIGLPDFSGSFSQDDYLGNEGSHFQEHFASQIVLRRLLVGFHTSLNNSPAASPILGSSSPPAAISQNTISQMDLQLEQWLGMLPVYLRWPPESPGDFPGQVPSVYPTDATIGTFPGALPSGPSIAQSATAASAMMFTTDLDTPITTYPFAVDIQVALLRSRYYYTKHLIHRPFVYKALHHMDSLTNEDCLGVAECLKASLKWPITMSPPSKRKRLIPCLFFWSRNLLGILVLLHLSQTVPILLKIRNTLCGDRFDLDADESVGLYIDWLRDVKSVDRSADWCWNVVKALYHLEDSP